MQINAHGPTPALSNPFIVWYIEKSFLSIFIPIQEQFFPFPYCIQICKLQGRCHDATRSMLNAPIPSKRQRNQTLTALSRFVCLLLMELFGVVREEGVDWCRLGEGISRCDVAGRGACADCRGTFCPCMEKV